MTSRRAAFAIGLGWLWTAIPAGAHHGFSSEYDEKKPVTLTGTVSKLFF